jgi:two-component system, chemotaxis family, protein-glutamate methylesterase/glutaminase
MRKARVLIVDDSVVIRRLLTDILSAEPDIEVVGAVGSHSLALAKIQQAAPDVVTLDVEMPGMSGLDLLVEIRKLAPRLPVIMFSSLTRKAAATTLDALANGATDYVAKPTGAGSLEASTQHVKSELVPKIRGLAVGRQTSVAPVAAPAAAVPAPPPLPPPQSSERRPVLHSVPPPGRGPLDVLVVGSSTGGPNALAQLFKDIPASFPVPVLIAQHMPPVFTRLLAERMTAHCPVPFEEARQGVVLEPGKGWIAPGDHHMRVARKGTQVVLTLDKEAPENSCRPAVDPLFRSVAEVFGARALALILTGMGQDGLRGSEALRAQGAQILAQDEKSSVVWGMPGFVAKAGLADAVLPLAELTGEILRRVARAAAARTAVRSRSESRG